MELVEDGTPVRGAVADQFCYKELLGGVSRWAIWKGMRDRRRG